MIHYSDEIHKYSYAEWEGCMLLNSKTVDTRVNTAL